MYASIWWACCVSSVGEPIQTSVIHCLLCLPCLQVPALSCADNAVSCSFCCQTYGSPLVQHAPWTPKSNLGWGVLPTCVVHWSFPPSHQCHGESSHLLSSSGTGGQVPLQAFHGRHVCSHSARDEVQLPMSLCLRRRYVSRFLCFNIHGTISHISRGSWNAWYSNVGCCTHCNHTEWPSIVHQELVSLVKHPFLACAYCFQFQYSFLSPHHYLVVPGFAIVSSAHHIACARSLSIPQQHEADAALQLPKATAFLSPCPQIQKLVGRLSPLNGLLHTFPLWHPFSSLPTVLLSSTRTGLRPS